MRNTPYKIFRFSDLVFAVLTLTMISFNIVDISAQTDKVIVAVSEFTAGSEQIDDETFGENIVEMLKTELSGYDDLIVVERTKIEAIYQELALSQTGILNDNKALEAGKLLGADFVITGELNFSKNRFRIDSHIANVKSGQVVGEKVTGPNKQAVEKMVQVLANNIHLKLTDNGNYISAQKVTHYPSKWFLAAGAGSTLVAALFHNSYNDKYDAYKSSSLLGEIEQNYDKANKAYRMRNVFIGTSVALLGTGMILWFADKSQGNTILAGIPVSDSGRLFVTPCYASETNMIGLNLTLHY